MEEAEAAFIELLQENGGCRLPCFVGLIPGKFTLQEMKSQLNRYQPLFADEFITSTIQRDEVLLRTWIFRDYDLEEFNPVIRALNVEMEAILPLETSERQEYGNSHYADIFQYYQLSNLLANYGPPEKVFILMEMGADMGFGDIFYIFVDYSTSGILVEIEVYAKSAGGDLYTACPNQGFTKLSLWQPKDLETASRYDFTERPTLLYTLEEATGLTVEEFYHQFKAPAKSCLETHMDSLPIKN